MFGVFQRVRRFLAELKRRKVYRVAIAYVAAAFAGLEGLDLLVPITRLPPWTPRLFLGLAILGFPVAIVLAWVFDLTREGVRRTERPEGDRPVGPRPAWVAAALLFALLAGGALWWSIRRIPRPDVDPTGRQVVAVLPFTVSGPGVEHLGEGMVNLLSTALDGAGGVRAVDQRTVLARWDRTAEVGGEPDLGTALEVARGLGAEWAIVGSVVSVGRDARFAARVVRPADGQRVGEAQVEGAVDSLLLAVDALTRDILGMLFERGEEDVSRIPMASLTTGSVPALKAFLTGERHYRRGRLDSAVVAYQRAVEEDSTFALAWLRRSTAEGWANVTGFPEAPIEAAYRYRERLPERGRLSVVGAYLLDRRDARAADTLEYGTERYPDDPELWSWLGEVYVHKVVCRGPGAADSAFSRAVELDPGFAPYWIHPIQLAIGFHRDSALAAGRIEAAARSMEGATGLEGYVRPRSAPGEDVDPNEDPWIRLVFGRGAIGERVEAFLDAAERGDVELEPGVINVNTARPSQWALRDTLLRRALARDAPSLSRVSAGELIENGMRMARIRRALEDLDRLEVDDRIGLYHLVWHRSTGVPVPDSLIRRQMEALGDSEIRGFSDLISRSLAAVELDAPELAPPLDEVLARMEEERGSDSARTAPVRHAIEGYRAWKAGDEERAIELLERGVPASLPRRLWLADLYRDTGRLEQAARCYRTEYEQPVAYRGLGDVLAEMGRTEEAVEAYRIFLEAWEGADPAVRPQVEAVRGRVTELSEPLESAESAAGG